MVGSVLSSFAIQSSLLISGPLVARMLGPEDRGLLALLTLVPGVLWQLVSIGLPLGVTYEVARRPDRARSILRSVVPLVLAQIAVVVPIQALALWLILGSEPAYVELAAIYTLAALPIILIHEYALSLLRGQGRFRASNALRPLPLALYAAGAAVAFAVGTDDLVTVAVLWVGAALAASAAAAFFAVYRLRDVAPTQSLGSTRRRDTVRFGLRSWLGSMSPTETFRIDQAVVGLLLSPTALGLYVVALAFTNLPRIVAQNMGMVIYPMLAARGPYGAARRAMWGYVAAGSCVCVAITLGLEVAVGTLLPFFFGNDFTVAVGPSRLLLVGAAFFAARRLLTDGTRGLGHPTLGTAAELVSWVLLPVSLAIFVPSHGLTGVALAFVVSSGVSFLVLVGLTLIAPRRARRDRRSVPAAVP